MSLIRLEFPALVERRSSLCRLRPLFCREFAGEGRTLELASLNLQKKIRRYFQHETLEGKTLQELLWLQFNPELSFSRWLMELETGRHYIQEYFSAAWFDLREYRYVYLPGFHHFFVARPLPGGLPGRAALSLQVREVILQLYQQEKTRQHGGLDSQEFFRQRRSENRERLTAVTQWVDAEEAEFPFLRWDEYFFDEIRGSGQHFRGRIELAKTSEDLAERYPAQLMRATGRDGLVEQVRRLIFRPENISLVLVGPSGAGKTAILHEALFRELAQAPLADQEKIQKIWHLDPNRVMAGMSIIGAWQRRLTSITQYMLDRLPKIKVTGRTDRLYVDNLMALLLLGKSAQNELTMADVLKTFMENNSLALIAECTPGEWMRVQEKHRRFADLFQVVQVPPVDGRLGMEIALWHRRRVELSHQCEFTLEALARMAQLQNSFLSHTALPGGLVSQIEQLAARHQGRGQVTAGHVQESFQVNCGVVRHIYDRTVKLTRAEIVADLRRLLIGQDEAVNAMVDVIQLIKAGLTGSGRPCASLLFTGPTGTGKTEAAKALARYLFVRESSLIRFDMNEYVDPEAAGRLIGSHHEPEGQLTGRVRFQPYCVLLLDEIEKAHPDVCDLLLQVLGEGRLTDAAGRPVDFSRSIIILTSNLGSREARRHSGFTGGELDSRNTYRQMLERHFRPEFLNRIDRTIIFRPLELEEIQRIAAMQLNELLQREGFIRRNTVLNVSPRTLEQIARTGYDPEMGGRALRRRLEKEITSLAAEQLVAIPPGQPVVFDVFSQRGQLLPRITALQEVEPAEAPGWELAPPAACIAKRYDQLAGCLRHLRDDLTSVRPSLEPDGFALDGMEAVTFRQLVNQELDQLEELKWEYEESRAFRSVAPGNHLPPAFLPLRRMKQGSGETVRTGFLRNLAKVLDERAYMLELYSHSRQLIGHARPEYARRFVRVAALDFFGGGNAAGERESLCLLLQPLVPDESGFFLKLLTGAYHQLLSEFGLYSEQPDETLPAGTWITATGPRLGRFFHPEDGVHLFLRPGLPPYLIQVHVVPVPAEISPRDVLAGRLSLRENWLSALESGQARLEHDPLPAGPVIRVYDLDQDNSEKPGPATICDLRSGFLHQGPMHTEDWLQLVMRNLVAMGLYQFNPDRGV